MTDNVVSKEKLDNKVLIVGGGDLIIAAYILNNYKNVSKLYVVDIDERVTEVTKKFFSFAEIIDKEVATGRLEVIHRSGAEFLDEQIKQGQKGTFGGVIVDCTDFALDENAIASELFSPQFYQNINDLLEPRGQFS